MPNTPTSNEPPLIQLCNVSRSFGDQPVLRDVHVAVDRGETLVIIGESGCGKSVTMKLMMALLDPTVGEVRWSGRPVADRNERELSAHRLRFGYLFQGAALFDSMSVYENVAFGLQENTQMPDEQIREIVLERLREVGLGESVCAKKPAELSGGMKKRVGLARALALSPEVIFYDEPTSGLDPIMSDVINELIVQTRQRRPVTSLVVTHDMRTVDKVADRVLMLYPLNRLERGESQVIFQGSSGEAFHSSDERVLQFVTGQAGARIRDMGEG